jgi:hypothetical protein
MPAPLNVLNQDTIKGIVTRLSEYILKNNIYPELAAEISSNLQFHLRNGEYNDNNVGEFLAFGLTVHLQEKHLNEHLWVWWHSQPLPDHQCPQYLVESWE